MSRFLSVKWTGSPRTARITDETGYEYKAISAMHIHLLGGRGGQPATADVEMFLMGENDIREISPTVESIATSQAHVTYLRKLLDDIQLEIDRLTEISIDQSLDKPQDSVPDIQQAKY